MLLLEDDRDCIEHKSTIEPIERCTILYGQLICATQNEPRMWCSLYEEKTVLSNRIFMEASPEYRKVQTESLRIRFSSRIRNDPPQIIKNLQRVRENLVSIPIGRTDSLPTTTKLLKSV